jgi:hypothetical protein
MDLPDCQVSQGGANLRDPGGWKDLDLHLGIRVSQEAGNTVARKLVTHALGAIHMALKRGNFQLIFPSSLH